MEILKLYKRFYRVSINSGSDVYTLFSPESLTASTFIAGTGNTESNIVVQENISTTEESEGVFYVSLDSYHYSSDKIYDLVFVVKYTESSPEKKLLTRFKVKPRNLTTQIAFEVNNNKVIEYEINNTFK